MFNIWIQILSFFGTNIFDIHIRSFRFHECMFWMDLVDIRQIFGIYWNIRHWIFNIRIQILCFFVMNIFDIHIRSFRFHECIFGAYSGWIWLKFGKYSVYIHILGTKYSIFEYEYFISLVRIYLVFVFGKNLVYEYIRIWTKIWYSCYTGQ